MWSIHLVVARFDSSMTVGFRVVETNSLRETTVASFSNEADRQSIPVRRIRSNPADLSRELPILRERLLHRVVLSQDGCDRCWFHETLDNKNLTEHFPLRFETPLSIQFSYEFLYDDRNEKGKIVRTRTSVDTCAALRFPFLYSTIIVRSDAVDSTVAAYLKWSSGGISDLEWIISRGKWWREVSQRSDALV